jgi:cell division protein FtsQ
MMRSRTNRRKSAPRKLRVPAIKAIKINVRAIATPPLLVLALLGALAGIHALLDRPVHALVVEGTFERVTALEIEAAAAPELKKGFLSLDLNALRRRVQDIDWVEGVEIERVWPGTLTIVVKEHQAAARWGAQGLLNVRGELFTEDGRYEFPELPHLAGPPGSEKEVAGLYLALRGKLTAAGLALDSLSMDERGAWHVRLRRGQEIRLGRRDVAERVTRFFDAAAPALAREFDRVSYIDLRYTNGFAVGWARPAAETQLSSLRGRVNSG